MSDDDPKDPFAPLHDALSAAFTPRGPLIKYAAPSGLIEVTDGKGWRMMGSKEDVDAILDAAQRGRGLRPTVITETDPDGTRQVVLPGPDLEQAPVAATPVATREIHGVTLALFVVQTTTRGGGHDGSPEREVPFRVCIAVNGGDEGAIEDGEIEIDWQGCQHIRIPYVHLCGADGAKRWADVLEGAYAMAKEALAEAGEL